jgi:hypothetical protein
MTAMGWGAVWQAAWTEFGAEPVEIRLLIMVMTAFAATMVLIGLRHAFRPSGPKAAEPLPELPKRVFAAPPPAPVAEPKPPPHRVRMSGPRTPRKSAKHTINRQRPLRPQIRRVERPTEIDAPYSPPPPQG